MQKKQEIRPRNYAYREVSWKQKSQHVDHFHTQSEIGSVSAIIKSRVDQNHNMLPWSFKTLACQGKVETNLRSQVVSNTSLS